MILELSLKSNEAGCQVEAKTHFSNKQLFTISLMDGTKKHAKCLSVNLYFYTTHILSFFSDFVVEEYVQYDGDLSSPASIGHY